MIDRYTVRADITPYCPATLDIETNDKLSGHEGELIGLGFGWQDETGERHYRAYESYHEWITEFRAIYKAAGKETRYRLRTIYAHYGANFDWPHMITVLRAMGFEIQLKSYQSGSIFIGVDVKLRVAGERFTLRLRDSYKLVPQSLAKLGATFHVSTRKMDLSELAPGKIKRDNPQLFWDYLRADVESLGEILRAFWQLIYEQVGSIDRLPMTLPSLAMRLFRMGITDPIMTPRNRKLKRLERDAYIGGRCECPFPGEYPRVRVYDINSQYPAVMRENIFPASYVGGWVEHWEGRDGVYRVRFRQTNRSVPPVLPVIGDDGAIRYTYEGEGAYYAPELRKLLAVGGMFQVIEGYVYYKMRPLFRDFIDRWYGVRLDAQKHGNDALAYVCKILMNSLYGKFGQSETGWSLQIWDRKTREKMMSDPDVIYRDYGECVMVREDRENETTFVGIAGYVTSYARALLYQYIETAMASGGYVVYRDTDSVHITDGGDLPTSSALGALKLEYDGRAIYLGRKQYRLSDIDKNKAKGIPYKIAATFTDETYRAALRGESTLIHYETAPSPFEVYTGRRAPAVWFERARSFQGTTRTTEEARHG